MRPNRLFAFFFLSKVVDLRRAGEGYEVKVFSSLELASCWEKVGWKIDVLEQGLRVTILILLGNSCFEFLSTSVSPPSLTGPWRERNLFRGNQKHKNMWLQCFRAFKNASSLIMVLPLRQDYFNS